MFFYETINIQQSNNDMATKLGMTNITDDILYHPKNNASKLKMMAI